MAKKVLLATEKAFAKTARDEVVGILNQAGYEAVLLENYKDKAQLIAAVADADALIIRSDVVDKEVLAAAKSLKLVVRAGAGYDNIDCAAAKERGVAAKNTPGQNSNAVAELALGLMVFMARNRFNGKSGTELRGKRLGIHGIGAVGRLVAGIGKGFGMTVKAFDPFLNPEQIKDAGAEPVATLQDLYSGSDYLSLHVPANKDTKKSIGFALLNLMPRGACLVNTARAEVIDEAGLLEALEKRPDLRYASDVEPSAATAEAIQAKYAERAYWTPKKIGAQTEEANVNAGLAAARQIVAFFERGEKRFIVNP
ncbi:MAG: 3-phosphoglycerate dehydrogenase [Deltaproteobacteria bacterium]|nr:3-phosphoglycerate dehydrogenase [Deltaproteobacteria bacterium]